MQIVAQGPRIYLREMSPSDWKAVNVYASDPKVIELQGWGPHTENDSKDWVALAIREASVKPRKMFYFGICLNADDQLIGGASVQRMTDPINYGTAEIGLYLRSDQWRQGYGREAIKLLIPHIFENTNIHRLVGRCREANQASARLLESVGFRKEGHFIRDVLIRGKLTNSYSFALLKEEYNTSATEHISLDRLQSLV
ncbi:MAG: GNAT family protein [Oligoflexia bacterium]|nr:GNAT family protein [Oligoflexia bacterium]